MELTDERDLLRLDLLTAMGTLGTHEVLRVLSESIKERGAKKFDDWDQDLQRLAAALQDLADRVADFEAHYEAREP